MYVSLKNLSGPRMVACLKIFQQSSKNMNSASHLLVQGWLQPCTFKLRGTLSWIAKICDNIACWICTGLLGGYCVHHDLQALYWIQISCTIYYDIQRACAPTTHISGTWYDITLTDLLYYVVCNLKISVYSFTSTITPISTCSTAQSHFYRNTIHHSTLFTKTSLFLHFSNVSKCCIKCHVLEIR